MKTIVVTAILISSLAFAETTTDRAKMDSAKSLLSSNDLGENKKGFLILKSLAESGLTDAKLGVGLMYFKGTGTKKNPIAAYEWYEKAAQDGNARALYLISTRYRGGCDGAKKDISKAEEFLTKALSKASKEEKEEIEALEKHRSSELLCSGETHEVAAGNQKKASFFMYPYQTYVFSGWDLENRRKCPKEHTNEKSEFVVFVDPKKYNIDNWCQCYLANVKQDTHDDISLLDQKIDFYTKACLKESLRK